MQIPFLILALGYDLVRIYVDWVAHASSQSNSGAVKLPDFSHLASHCAHIPPIPTSSFIERQDSLARALQSLNASAYIAEPGASAGFFANLSHSSWHLSERPLLLIVQPQVNAQGLVRANISILTPAFEETRAKLLSIPNADGITYIAWPEDTDPYAQALAAVSNVDGVSIFVDGDVRTFITDGLQKAAPQACVSNAPAELKRLRERKSAEELGIMKCVNEVNWCIYIMTR